MYAVSLVETKFDEDVDTYWNGAYFHYNLKEAKLYSSVTDILLDRRLINIINALPSYRYENISIIKVEQTLTITQEGV